ncbi:DUF2303 family protein [Oceanicola sp. D3]|uniref:DUF2303 family protein n=1 Tax=Oceanicola sp. D3 TaxID=2587163 RepID=UPI00111D28FC|nr:DUF2303 family protein [Oceanicola sp. D3]QDC11253.1 DUF2303 family protein [Oceanicola sp. D3]
MPKKNDETASYPAEAEAKAAFDATLTAARLADPVIPGEHGVRHCILPEGYTAHDISDRYALPPRIQQRVQVDDADSLTTYANRFSDERSLIVADLDKLQIHAELDWHRHNQSSEGSLDAQATKHTATLQLRNSEEFARWSEIEGKLLDQMAFAEFLDENSSDIVDPDPAVMLEVARDLEATQGVSFKASTRLQTGERSLRYETETHTKGDLVVPQRFTLSIPLFFGEEPSEIVASFRFRPNPDGLKLGFVWRRVECVRQAKFRDIAFRVSEHTGLPVVQGRRA